MAYLRFVIGFGTPEREDFRRKTAPIFGFKEVPFC
jgi:hypothetical protein